MTIVKGGIFVFVDGLSCGIAGLGKREGGEERTGEERRGAI